MGYPLPPVRPTRPDPSSGSAVPALLALADGTVFSGFSRTAGEAAGEVVFNTSLFGYQEMLTDPSYHGQILVLTAPHVGNVGWNPEDDESGRVWARGLIVPEFSLYCSNWRAVMTLGDRLGAEGVPVGWGFDTRALVLHLRSHGALPGVLACGNGLDEEDLRRRAAAVPGTDGRDLTGEVSRRRVEGWAVGPWRPPGAAPAVAAPGPRVVVLDCGVKRSILRQLVGAGAEVLVVPGAAPVEDVLALSPAGVVLSNGPGDPAAVAATVRTARALLGRLPLLGICLGHQLLALALGGRTYKLPFGHHGANHPVRHEATREVWITSQNHNYAVDPDSLPTGVEVTMVNLTDGSVEGLAAAALQVEGIQFHPEAGPGPHDALGVFSRFVMSLVPGTDSVSDFWPAFVRRGEGVDGADPTAEAAEEMEKIAIPGTHSGEG